MCLFSLICVQVANVWYSVNGERLGTYNGHTGAVWCVDCDCILPIANHINDVFCLLNTECMLSLEHGTECVWVFLSLTLLSGDTKNVLTGSADNSCRLWDCETGEGTEDSRDPLGVWSYLQCCPSPHVTSLSPLSFSAPGKPRH